MLTDLIVTAMNLFEEIKRKVRIEEVVGRYLRLKPQGRYLVGQCPFHQDDTPSFAVTPERGIFYCFGCKKHGDVIDFVSEIEKIGKGDAAKLIASWYGIEVAKWGIEGSSSNFTLTTVLDVAAGRFHRLLVSDFGLEAREYLARRKIPIEILKRFRVGYFPTGTKLKRIIGAIVREGIALETLISAGLLNQRGDTSLLENRVVFPVRNFSGRTIAFGGRTFAPGDDRPKYVNTRETEIFKKGAQFYGIDLAASSIRKSDFAVIVEGYIDLLAMHTVGVANSVATLGTAITREHLRKLSRLTRNITVFVDSDHAGLEAVRRLFRMPEAHNFELSVAVPRGAKDPAEMLERGVDVKAALVQAERIYEFYGRYLLREQGSSGAIREVAQDIAAVTNANPLIASVVTAKFAAAIGVPQRVLEDEVGKIMEERSAPRVSIESGSGAQQETWAEEGNDDIVAMVAMLSLAKEVPAMKDLSELLPARLRELFMSAVDSDDQVAAVTAVADERLAGRFLGLIVELPLEDLESMRDILRAYLRRRWPRFLSEFRSAGGNVEKLSILRRVVMELLD